MRVKRGAGYAYRYTTKPRTLLSALPLPRSAQKALADCGAAFEGRLSLFCTMGDSRLFHGAKTRRLHLELGNKEKKKQRKIARGIFRSLAPLLGTAGSLSDCGIKPTIAELNFSRR